jgi:hypothetical protein
VKSGAAQAAGAAAVDLPWRLAMQQVLRALTPFFLALAFAAVTPAEALAYVDPGTGSYLFQLAAAGLLAGMFTIRRFWDALKSRFRNETAPGRSSHTE